MNEKNNQQGIAILVAIIAVGVVALLMGGIFYFLGSQKTPKQLSNGSILTPIPTSVSNGVSDETFEKQLNETDLESIDQDLEILDRETSSL